jgi:hypothetical protein
VFHKLDLRSVGSAVDSNIIKPFYRPVHTGPLAKLVSYFFAAA